MDLRKLRYFLAVASELNFSQAAEQLCISQTSVSRRIAELEAELKLQLFRRRPRPLVLTPAGERLAGHARRILHQLEEARLDLHEYRSDSRLG